MDFHERARKIDIRGILGEKLPDHKFEAMPARRMRTKIRDHLRCRSPTRQQHVSIHSASTANPRQMQFHRSCPGFHTPGLFGHLRLEEVRDGAQTGIQKHQFAGIRRTRFPLRI